MEQVPASPSQLGILSRVAQETLMHHSAALWQLIVAAGSGGGALRALNYISKQMPPLPPNAGWWKSFFYSLMKGASGHDATNNPPTVKP
jgi:hypothetical protein